MLVACTDELIQNSFFSPTRSKEGTSTTHSFNARGMMFLLEAGKMMDERIKGICLASTQQQFISVRNCRDEVDIAIGEISRTQNLPSRSRSR